MLTPLFLKTEVTSVRMPHSLIEDLLTITINAPHTILRIIQGILSEFTKQSVHYSEDVKQIIVDTLLNFSDKLDSSNVLNVFTLRLAIHFKAR